MKHRIRFLIEWKNADGDDYDHICKTLYESEAYVDALWKGFSADPEHRQHIKVFMLQGKKEFRTTEPRRITLEAIE